MEKNLFEPYAKFLVIQMRNYLNDSFDKLRHLARTHPSAPSAYTM